MKHKQILLNIYDKASRALGPSNWWPGESSLEIMVGAILVQNTNWSNAEKAIASLKAAMPLTVAGILSLEEALLAELIKSAGCAKVKAARLRNLLLWLQNICGEDTDFLRALPLEQLRSELLSIKGVGPETADAILLYALQRPSFVVDAYAKRILLRHGLVSEGDSYTKLHGLFMQALPHNVGMFNEFHALFVRIGKLYCVKLNPRCGECPLRSV